MKRKIRFRILAEDLFDDGKYVWQYFDLPDDLGFGNEIYLNEDWYKMESFGEFTGLKDKNSKEIYEGDIMKYGGEVRWEHDICGEYGCVGFKGVSDGHYSGEYDSRFDEVIGNVNENPELLSGLAEPRK